MPGISESLLPDYQVKLVVNRNLPAAVASLAGAPLIVHRAALRAICQRCIRNLLQDVLGMTAGPAFVGVNWHGEKGSVKP